MQCRIKHLFPGAGSEEEESWEYPRVWQENVEIKIINGGSGEGRRRD